MLNVANRTLFTGDNLDVMRGINSECIDLIYLDPPFNSNQDFAAPIGSQAAGAAFKDTWTLHDVDLAWHGQIADDHPGLYAIIDAAGECHSKSMKAYLIMMGVRLLEMKRLLKPTGSIYLHCDPTASHYLKMVMDAVFGKDHFANEVIWSYRRWPAKSRKWQTMHDVLLFYISNGDHVWNQQFEPLAESTLKTFGTKKQVADFSQGKRLPRQLEEETKGARMRAVWELGVIAPSAKERLGYPTQKPLKLLERIIKASSHEGQMVLDPFCGCATACVAAEHLQREWIGIDLSEKAADLVRHRLADATGIFGKITHRTDIPVRTDVYQMKHYSNFKNELYGRQEGKCNGCRTLFKFQNLTVDHIIPKSKGGQDNEENPQLLCGHCNSIKGNRDMAYLLAKLQRMESRN